MAGRPGLFYFNEKRVLIAVIENVLDVLHISRRLPFLPELLARAAPVPGETGLNGPLERSLVHISNHKNFAGLPFLDHRRDKTIIIKLEIYRYFHAVLLSQTEGKVQKAEKQ